MKPEIVSALKANATDKSKLLQLIEAITSLWKSATYSDATNTFKIDQYFQNITDNNGNTTTLFDTIENTQQIVNVSLSTDTELTVSEYNSLRLQDYIVVMNNAIKITYCYSSADRFVPNATSTQSYSAFNQVGLTQSITDIDLSNILGYSTYVSNFAESLRNDGISGEANVLLKDHVTAIFLPLYLPNI
jgi:hypothetical protein